MCGAGAGVSRGTDFDWASLAVSGAAFPYYYRAAAASRQAYLFEPAVLFDAFVGDGRLNACWYA
jgi:hypothetical protein